MKPLDVARASKPGLYPDGGGLYLQITDAGVKSWVFRYAVGGRERYMGLGALHTVKLAEAREQATDARKLRLAGIDPIQARDAETAKARLASARSTTFKEAAEGYIEAHESGWSNERQAALWKSTLEAYVYPHIGGIPVQDIDQALIVKVLRPIWSKKPETASRVRGRIENIIGRAIALGLRSGENPARWKDNLDNLLPSHSKVRSVKHFTALPYTAIGAFTQDLRAQDGIAARALEFLILTASRTSEVIGARWSEINLRDAVWTVPAERIKSRRVHRVPLTKRALAILAEMAELRATNKATEYVFPGGKKKARTTGKADADAPSTVPLSNMAFLALLDRMKVEVTAHGFRSSFRDWAAEQTNFAREVAEQSLAHTVPDAVERAYRRGDLFEKRRALMDGWEKYCNAPKRAGKVVAFARA